MKSFWKEVQHTNNKIKKSEVIDGKNDTSDIIDIFTKKYLQDTPVASSLEEDLLKILRNRWITQRKYHLKISAVTLRKLIGKLNVGEGHDGVHSSFLKRASGGFLDILSRFIMGEVYDAGRCC